MMLRHVQGVGMDTNTGFVNKEGAVFFAQGEIDQHNVDAFCLSLMQIPKGAHIDMGDLDIEDGAAMACIVSALRRLRPVVLIEAPQMLAHTIYKTYMLSTEITLVRPRFDDDFR